MKYAHVYPQAAKWSGNSLGNSRWAFSNLIFLGLRYYLIFSIVCVVLFCVANCHPNQPTNQSEQSQSLGLSKKFGAPLYTTFIDVAK
jgi:hypothetical protein